VGQKVLVALGGNAILRYKEKGTANEQLENIRKTSRHLVHLLKNGYKIAITHGNGPQVGDILIKNELSSDMLPPMPLDICGAQSQGMIGYMLQQSMQNEMTKTGIHVPVVSIVTQTIIDGNDKAFQQPTKPIGPFYDTSEAEVLRKKKGWTIIEDSGRGYRRVVPSPNPKAIVERDIIRLLYERGVIVIAVGGGGVPVIIEEDYGFKGVEAVVDKDLGAQVLANSIDVDILLMLTDVENVSLNYGKVDKINLDKMTIHEAQRYLQEGHFPPGSMGPKIEAAIKFVQSGGEKAVISSLEKAWQALEGTAGTTIHS
jgi:carbamate kinase